MILLASYAVPFGILLDMFNTRLVNKERVVQDHKVVIFDAEDVTLKELNRGIIYWSSVFEESRHGILVQVYVSGDVVQKNFKALHKFISGHIVYAVLGKRLFSRVTCLPTK